MLFNFLSGFICTLTFVVWGVLMTLCIITPFLLSYFTFWYLLLYLITIPIMGGLIAVIRNR
jgi:hypothetical protein